MSPDSSPQPSARFESRLAERFGLFQPLSTMIYPQTQAALTSKLKWVTMIRVLTATLLLGSAIGLQVRAGEMNPMITALYVLAVGMYAFSVACALLLFRVPRLMLFALFQFLTDTFFVSALIYVTGSAESVFSFLYFFNIIAAAYVLFAPGAFITATLSCLTYASILFSTRFGMIPYFRMPDPHSIERGFFLYNLTINIFAFYLVAFLSSYLTGQIRRAGLALRQGQGQIREVQALKNRIVESIGSGVITLNGEGIITSANSAFESISGHGGDELLGRSLNDILPEVGPGEVTQGDWECTYRRPDGASLILGFKVSPLRSDAGEEVGTILIVDDLTRIRAMEESMRRDERLATVGRLAAGIAHEIRNPLASISGSIQILQSVTEPGGEESRLMDIAVRETDRLNDLLTHFLQYVRQAPIQRTPIDLGSLISETVAAIQRDPRAQGKGVSIFTEYKHSHSVVGDPNQLRQVMWNLILNAVDAVHEGGEVRICTRDGLWGGGGSEPTVELEVSDNGAGIPPELVARIFDPFFSTKAKGTGLGLAMVEKIVQAHDGRIIAENLDAGGARFNISFQSLAPSAEAPHAAPAATVSAPTS